MAAVYGGWVKPIDGEAGYENIWLLGISMGGLGTLLYASEYPEQVDGVVLLAPFLGDRSAIETIVATGPLEERNGEITRSLVDERPPRLQPGAGVVRRL